MGAKRLRKRADKIVRQNNVMRRLVEGADVETVAEIVGISVTTVQRDVNEALDRIAEDTERYANRLRSRQQVELDIMRAALMPKAKDGVRSAIETMIKLHRRESQLLGLDTVRGGEPPRDDEPLEVELLVPANMSPGDYDSVEPDKIDLPTRLLPAKAESQPVD